MALSVVFHFPALLALLLAVATSTVAPQENPHHDYCIIGAGPAGLQMGYFLKRANRDYIVLERSNVSGHFFETYPRHRKLISINKLHTGESNKEYNLRHDWNSLLSDDGDLLFGRYSREVFPPADALLDYLHDFQQKLGINVMFNTEARDVRHVPDDTAPDGVLHVLNDQSGNTFVCKVLVVATGLWKPNIPDMKGVELALGYEDMSIDPADYEGQEVLILGRGNAAFEVADGIYGTTNSITMLSRSRVRLSWATHYVGDLRAVNNGLLDTYQLKTLDRLLEVDVTTMKLTKDGNKVKVSPYLPNATRPDSLDENFPLRTPYDKVIRCTGFTYDNSLFSSSDMQRGEGRAIKYPAIKHNYESVSQPGLFFAGTLSHSLDFRKSAGGFIHGFRYTARALSRILDSRYEGVPWPSLQLPVSQLLNQLLRRMNEASGLYQMFQMLGDVVVFSEDGQTVRYYEEFPVNILPDLATYSGLPVSRVLVFTLEYGQSYSGPDQDVFRYTRFTDDPSNAHNSNFLHPVLYYYTELPSYESMATRQNGEVLPRPSLLHHVVEDFLAFWTGPSSHVTPIRHFLDQVTRTDLRHRYSQSCLVEAMTHRQPSRPCQDGFLHDQGLTALPDWSSLAAQSGPAVA